ncbi:hypothetical protein JCM1393_08320 [Clostridium carnis]
MSINTNISALTSNRAMSSSSNLRDKISNKLSTGFRINSAADDAAGLSISEKMRSQIRGLEQASRNASYGISLIQTADGALSETTDIIQRLRELSVQASNSIYTTEDRDATQTEIKQLIKQVDRIANDTEFNNKKLLNGSIGNSVKSDSLSSVVNSSNGLNIIYVENTDNFATTATSSGTLNNSATFPILSDKLQTEIVPQAVTNILKQYSPAFDYLENSSIGIGLKIYTDASTNTLASVGVGYSKYSDGSVATNLLTYTLSVNTNTLKFIDNDLKKDLTDDSRRNLESTIAHEMMHALMDESVTNGMIGVSNGKLDSTNVFPGWFKEGMAQTASGGYDNDNDWVNNALHINKSTSLDDISKNLTSPSNILKSNSTEAKYGTGYLASMYLGYLAGGNNIDNIATGLGAILNKLTNGDSLDSVIKDASNDKYLSVSDFENKFGDIESSTFISNLTKNVGEGNGGLVSGNLKDTDLLSNSSISTNLFKLDTTTPTVQNIYPSTVNVFSGGGTKVNGTNSEGKYIPVPIGGGYGKISNYSDGINIQLGANSGQCVNLKIGSATSRDLGISNLSITNTTSANKAINSCDNALKYVSTIRSTLGAYQNRLEHSISNLDNTAENLTSSESRIRDIDMAKGISELLKYNILQQASQAMLSQANINQQSILSLLR